MALLVGKWDFYRTGTTLEWEQDVQEMFDVFHLFDRYSILPMQSSLQKQTFAQIDLLNVQSAKEYFGHITCTNIQKVTTQILIDKNGW